MTTVATINVGDLKKGLKVVVDGEPYLINECNFVKPGKGQAMYKLKLKNLIRGSTLDRTYRSGDSLEGADVAETEAQYSYKQGENFVFIDSQTFDQIELTPQQVDDAWKYLKEGMVCQITLWNGKPILLFPPNHVTLKVEYAEPHARGNTATNITKPCKVETGAEIPVPPFVEIGDLIRVDTRTGEYVERIRE